MRHETIADRMKRIEQAVQEMKVIQCDACRDGEVVSIDFPGRDSNSCGPYDESGKCRACGHEANDIIQIVVPGFPHPIEARD